MPLAFARGGEYMTGTPGRDREHLLYLALTILESPTPDDPWLDVLRELVDALRIADREREQVQRLQPLLHAVDARVAGGTAQAAAPPADPGITRASGPCCGCSRTD